MQEYIANGVRLGWLIDRQHQQAWVCRDDQVGHSIPSRSYPKWIQGGTGIYFGAAVFALDRVLFLLDLGFD